MFDFSFGEIGLIALVALVVLGPERLPKVARTAGALVRRARTSWQSVKDEIERELETEELKRSLNEARAAAADLHNDMHAATKEIHASTQDIATEVKASTMTPTSTAADADPAVLAAPTSAPSSPTHPVGNDHEVAAKPADSAR